MRVSNILYPVAVTLVALEGTDASFIGGLARAGRGAGVAANAARVGPHVVNLVNNMTNNARLIALGARGLSSLTGRVQAVKGFLTKNKASLIGSTASGTLSGTISGNISGAQAKNSGGGQRRRAHARDTLDARQEEYAEPPPAPEGVDFGLWERCFFEVADTPITIDAIDNSGVRITGLPGSCVEVNGVIGAMPDIGAVGNGCGDGCLEWTNLGEDFGAFAEFFGGVISSANGN